MTTVEAMKQLLCYIKNDGSTIEDYTETNATSIWVLIGEAFNARFNGGASASGVGSLEVECGEGATSGTTRPYVTGAVSGESYVYMMNVTEIPAAGADLSAWTQWDGMSDIPANDGDTICIAQVDASGIVTRAGIGAVVAAI